MAREEYREALSAAREDLRQVLADRAALDQRAGELKKIIDGLAVLCDETDHSSGNRRISEWGRNNRRYSVGFERHGRSGYVPH
jgi:hypothetical protein